MPNTPSADSPVRRGEPEPDSAPQQRAGLVPDLDPGDWNRAEINLLGSFRLSIDDRPAEPPIPSRRLVAFLALERRTVARHIAAGVLWPDKTEERALANLRAALWRLNGCVDGLVVCQRGSLALDDRAVVDIDRFTGPTVDAGRSALDALPARTELLIDWDDEWVMVERERVRQLTLSTLESATDDLADAGRFHQAVAVGMEAVRLAPLRESAHRSVIRAHLANGNYAEALHQFRSFETILADALDVAPSIGLRSLLDDAPARQPVLEAV